MNKQQIFDTVVNHLAAQGKRAMRNMYAAEKPDWFQDGSTEQMSCAYRGENGAKCAVGCLIPDYMYDPSMEGCTVNTLVDMEKIPTDLLPHINLLTDLQQAHDWAESRSDLVNKLEWVASIYLLEYTSVSNIKSWQV